MAKLIVTCVLIALFGSTLSDPDRPGQYLKHNKTVKSCAKYKREANQYQCVLSPFNTEGPYYLPDDHERSDIRDGVDGIPLELTINVVNSNDCTPLEHMYVHLWHTNALGKYSGVSNSGPPPGPPGNNGEQQLYNGGPKGPKGGFGEHPPHEGGPKGPKGPKGGENGEKGGANGGMHGRPTPVSDERFLRGYQVTDSNGQVTFTTILPGWYQGRCLHMHLEVYPKNSTAESDILYVGQIFFKSELPSELKLIDPYSQNTQQVTLNEDDGIYHHHGDETIIELVNQGKGYTATMTFGIDPNAKSKHQTL